MVQLNFQEAYDCFNKSVPMISLSAVSQSTCTCVLGFCLTGLCLSSCFRLDCSSSKMNILTSTMKCLELLDKLLYLFVHLMYKSCIHS